MAASKLHAEMGQNQSYCFNPSCQHPENPANALQCQCCGAKLWLQNRYRAIRLIGQGGFGRTFLVVDELQPSAPYCVVKQFFPQQWGSHNTEKAAELFHQEAQRLATLGNHPHIPKLLAFFEDSQWQYLVQEFVDGDNLAQELAEAGAFNEIQVWQLLRDILPILQFVHSHKVIHRDIKPENLIRRRRDRTLVLVDFGAAKYATETTLGKTGTVIGSAAYTAPEQVRGKAIYASDLYSLGVMCIHLLTHVPPFELFDSSEGVWVWRHYLARRQGRQNSKFKIQNSKFALSPLTPHLGRVLDKLLQTGTSYRYQSAEEVLKDLHSVSVKARRRIKKRWLVAGAVLIIAVGIPAARFAKRMLFPPSPVPAYTATTEPRIQAPETAGLYTQQNGQQRSFPLQHTEVMARVIGNVSRVEVTQTFTNPYNEPLEAIYVFPLPDEAAVDDMEIRVGDRLIRGVIKQRQEAEQVYEQAKREGKTAGLLEQERDNLFTQSLANIRPGEKIDVTIRYTDSLKFAKGSYEFAFPTVVGPRYVSNAAKLAGAARITAPARSPETLSGQELGVTVEIDAGVPIQTITSPSHAIQTTQDGRLLRVQLAKTTIPNQDLVLRYRVANSTTQSTVLAEADQRGGHFAAYLIPAVQYPVQAIVPKDVVFLVDTSGSQAGQPMADSKALIRRFINGLNPNDTFTIIDFANATTQLSATPLANTAANRQKAIAYINKLQANGGTELMNGIRTVQNFPPASGGRLRSIVLLTDGLIGEDEQAIAAVQKGLKPGNRLYSFGVGPSVNRFLIDRLAEIGQGTSQVVMPGEPAQKIVERFFEQINNPVLTNIQAQWEGPGHAPQIYPLKASDLFANQPLVLFGRKGDRSDGVLRITGTTATGQQYETRIPIDFANSGSPSAPVLSGGIAQLWGRARIKDLMNPMYFRETQAGIKAVTETALEYRLMSKYTAFVAVSQENRVDPSSGRHILIPVEPLAGTQDANAEAVPEPEQILGTLLAALLLLKFGCKRRQINKPLA